MKKKDGKKQETPELKTKAERANTLHSEIEGAGRDNLARAIEIGRIVGPIRESLKDGKKGSWLAWVKENLKFTDTTARTYINLAAAEDKGWLKNANSLSEAELTVRKRRGGARSKKNATAATAAIGFSHEPLSKVRGFIKDVSGERKNYAAVKISAETIGQFRSRLNLAFEKHHKEIEHDGFALIILKLQAKAEKGEVSPT